MKVVFCMKQEEILLEIHYLKEVVGLCPIFPKKQNKKRTWHDEINSKAFSFYVCANFH